MRVFHYFKSPLPEFPWAALIAARSCSIVSSPITKLLIVPSASQTSFTARLHAFKRSGAAAINRALARIVSTCARVDGGNAHTSAIGVQYPVSGRVIANGILLCSEGTPLTGARSSARQGPGVCEGA